MTSTTRTAASAGTDGVPTLRATRAGAWLGLAAVVLMVGGLALEAPVSATHRDAISDVVGFYTGADAVTYAGGYLDSVGLILFLPFVVTVSARVRTAGGILSPTARLAGAAYVVLCLSPGQAGGAAGLWLGSHGTGDAAADSASLLALNDLRAFGYYLALLALAAFLATVGIAGAATGRLARWASWSAIGVGGLLAGGVAVAHTGLADVASLLSLVWVVAVAVSLIRSPGPVPAGA